MMNKVGICAAFVVDGLLLALLVSLAGCAGAGGQAPLRAPVYGVGELQAGDAVTVTVTGRDVVLDIRSEKGIGSAEIEQAAGGAPASLTLRFHLAGLEELRFSYADVQVTVHVSSLAEGGVREEMGPPGGEPQPIGPDSAYWMAVRLPAGGRIPLIGGAIELAAPRAFLEGDARGFSLRWIDFYR